MSEVNTLPAEEIVRSAWEHADLGGNDRGTRVVYAAGFFDGEGWVSIASQRYQPVLMVGAGQKVDAPLRLLSDLWGGAICWGKDGMYRWRISGDRAAGALREMLEYLTVKQKQAEVGLRFHGQRAPRPRVWADKAESGRQQQRRYRARQRGEDVSTSPHPRFSPEVYERAQQFRQELLAARP